MTRLWLDTAFVGAACVCSGLVLNGLFERRWGLCHSLAAAVVFSVAFALLTSKTL